MQPNKPGATASWWANKMAKKGFKSFRSGFEQDIINISAQNNQVQNPQPDSDKTDDLFEFAPLAYFTIGRDGRITRTNQAGVHLLISEQPLTGERFATFLTKSDKPIFRTFLRQVFKTKVRQTCELTLLVGKNLVLIAQIEAVSALDGRECRAVVVDISARKHGEQQIQQYIGQLATAGEMGRLLATSLNQDEIYKQLGNSLHQLLPDISTIFISRFDPESELITAVFALQDGISIDVAELPAIKLLPPGKGTQSDVIRTGQPLIVADLRKKLRKSKVVTIGTAGPYTKSAIYVPMVAQEKILGVMQVQSATLNRFTDVDVQLLTLVGNTAAVTIQNAALFEDTKNELTLRKQRERELEILSTVSAALRTAKNRQEMFPTILEQLITLLNVDGAALELIHPYGGHLVTELGMGIWSSMTGKPISAQGGLSMQVMAGGEAYLENGSADKPSFDRSEVFQDCRAVAAALLSVQGQSFGLLWIGSQRNLNNHDVSLLTSIANFAASAIQRSTLHEQTEKRLQQLTAQRTIDQAISSSFDLNYILKTLLTQTILQLKIDAGVILLINQQNGMLEFAVGIGFQPHEIENAPIEWGKEDSLASKVILEQRTCSQPDIKSFPRIPIGAANGFVSQHATPLIVKGQVRGILEVFQRTPNEPDPDWISSLESFAGQAAIAIENTRLFEELQNSNAELSQAYDTTIEGWSRAMDLRDQETEGHTQRVTETTLRLALCMDIPRDQVIHLRRGALLHDIGKMGIPDNILLKPGKLTDEEWVIMRKHPQFAYDMLYPIPYLRPALDIPYCHHEKWDGSGYPRGLKGQHIPISARIFSIVDVWDAITSDRPYRAAWSKEKALDYIREINETHFDPMVVDGFLKFLAAEQVESVR